MQNGNPHRKRAVYGCLILGLLLIWLIYAVSDSSDAVRLHRLEDGVQYVSELGWTVNASAATEQKTTLPETFNAVYTEYNALQLRQGFDLTAYAGRSVIVYQLPITDYPNNPDVCISLMTYRGHLIGADMHALAMNGFMDVLKAKEAP